MSIDPDEGPTTPVAGFLDRVIASLTAQFNANPRYCLGEIQTISIHQIGENSDVYLVLVCKVFEMLAQFKFSLHLRITRTSRKSLVLDL